MTQSGPAAHRRAGGRRFRGRAAAHEQPARPARRHPRHHRLRSRWSRWPRCAGTGPHVILLDLEMPRMDGITFLKQIMATDPMPVVVCSGFAEPGTIAGHARAGGGRRRHPAEAPRVRLRRPSTTTACSTSCARRPRRGSVRPASSAHHDAAGLRAAAGAQARARARRRAHRVTGAHRVASDTDHRHRRLDRRHRGAARRSCARCPHDAPGIVIVQHMPAGFTAAFAEHLADICKMEVREAVARRSRRCRGRALRGARRPPPRVRRRGFDLVVELGRQPARLPPPSQRRRPVPLGRRGGRAPAPSASS